MQVTTIFFYMVITLDRQQLNIRVKPFPLKRAKTYQNDNIEQFYVELPIT